MKIVKVRSLRFKLSWIHGLVISAVVVCVGFLRYQTISYRVQKTFDQNLQRDARLFVDHLNTVLDPVLLTTEGLSSADRIHVEELRPHFVATDGDGKVLRPDVLSPFMREMITIDGMAEILRGHSGLANTVGIDGETYRVVTLPAGTMPYYVHLGRSIGALSGVLDEYKGLYLDSFPLMLVISVGVGWFLAGRALKPFEEVARTAGQITSENLNTQIVTQHKELEVQSLVQSFNAMVGRLERSFRQMRQFNADAAHELRTPLAILQGENEIALRSRNVPDEIRSVLASNLEELDRLTRIVNDMLTLAEAEAGKQVLNKKSIELRRILLDLMEQVRLLAAEKRVHLTASELAEARLNADELWIRRALLNVLDNAIKYSREGGQIEIRAVVQDPYVRIWIRDHGIGIAREDLPRIFDRLYRADPARGRASGGVGLGLSLVRWIVEAHDGRIQVESLPERGTTFEILLPIA